MKQGIVKFSKEFITPTGLKEWVSLEWEVGEPFDESKAMEIFMKVKDFVCNSQTGGQGLIDNHNNFVPGSPPPVINIQRTPEDERIAKLIGEIYACTEIQGDNGLLSYNKLAQTNREALNAFDIMFRKLAEKWPCESLDDNK